MMNKRPLPTLTALLLAAGVMLGASPSASAGQCPAFLDHDFKKLRSSQSVNLCEVAAGKPMLIVNTASHCGYTPQLKGLEALHQKYRGAQEVSDLGRELYERIRVMTGHLDRLRDSLDRAVGAFNAAVGSFEGRVLPSARGFRELGAASTSEEIPVLEPLTGQAREIQAPDARPPA